ncbi:MAG: hypothetical protein QOJ54_783, partial [Aliidongia sp.]|nr:hypothetical protein [Aliidongia sp.]
MLEAVWNKLGAGCSDLQCPDHQKQEREG